MFKTFSVFLSKLHVIGVYIIMNRFSITEVCIVWCLSRCLSQKKLIGTLDSSVLVEFGMFHDMLSFIFVPCLSV